MSLKNLNVERSILQIYCDKPAKVRMAWGDIWGDTEKGYTQANWRLVVVHTLRYLPLATFKQHDWGQGFSPAHSC